VHVNSDDLRKPLPPGRPSLEAANTALLPEKGDGRRLQAGVDEAELWVQVFHAPENKPQAQRVRKKWRVVGGVAVL